MELIEKTLELGGKKQEFEATFEKYEVVKCNGKILVFHYFFLLKNIKQVMSHLI